jgi:hypothetical protein
MFCILKFKVVFRKTWVLEPVWIISKILTTMNNESIWNCYTCVFADQLVLSVLPIMERVLNYMTSGSQCWLHDAWSVLYLISALSMGNLYGYGILLLGLCFLSKIFAWVAEACSKQEMWNWVWNNKVFALGTFMDRCMGREEKPTVPLICPVGFKGLNISYV